MKRILCTTALISLAFIPVNVVAEIVTDPGLINEEKIMDVTGQVMNENFSEFIEPGTEVLLEELALQIADDSIEPDAVETLMSLSLVEKEWIVDYLSTLLAPEELETITKAILGENGPSINGTRVPYYYRYYVWDTNDQEWEYVYVFRLGTASQPRYYRHWYKPWGTCWPAYIWVWGSQWRNPYFKDGSWYWEFLFSKTRVDWLTCYGYIELEYWW